MYLTSAGRPSGLGRLRGLRWRLTISYALVTLIAALTMSTATAVAHVVHGVVPADQAGAAVLLEKSAAAAAPYLTGSAPDPDTVRFRVAVPVVDELSRQTHARVLAVAVFDRGGHLLTASSCTQQQYTAATAQSCQATARSLAESLLADPTGLPAVRAAAENVGGAPITATVAGHGILAAPVPGDKQSYGALVAIFDGAVPTPPGRHPLATFIALWQAGWSPAWLPLIGLSLLLGTITGLAFSHRLVRRVRAMTSTVRLWSRGDLGPTVSSRGRDELAQLGSDLNHMAEQIRNLLAARREIATLEERHRIQRDLHDGVKQDLFAAAMHLAAARASVDGRTSAAIEHLDHAQRSAQRAHQELTAIIDQLRPAVLSPDGLPAAIADLCAQFEHQTGIRVHADLPPALTLADNVETALIRVLQEALTNIRRHAAATSVTITLTATAEEVRLAVTDNGRGLPDPLPVAAGLGLTNMRERTEALGGRFHAANNDPGTRIDIVIRTAGGDADV
jgi:NarL family two-component system sensor histidine kinase LiaS